MSDPPAAARPREPSDKPRRFYEAASVQAGEGGWAVRLDGRGARTPAGRPLALPTQGLAERVAAEWAAQGDRIDTARMPATRLACTAIDRAGQAREGLADEVARYAGSDLLCYFAESPAALVERQARAWAPLLDWAREALDLRLTRASGIVPVVQPAPSLERARDLALTEHDFALTGLAFAAGLFGSAVLALAVRAGRLSGLEAHALARLDEQFQEEQWGVDAEAEARANALLREAEMVDGWFRDLDAR